MPERDGSTHRPPRLEVELEFTAGATRKNRPRWQGNQVWSLPTGEEVVVAFVDADGEGWSLAPVGTGQAVRPFMAWAMSQLPGIDRAVLMRGSGAPWPAAG